MQHLLRDLRVAALVRFEQMEAERRIEHRGRQEQHESSDEPRTRVSVSACAGEQDAA